MIETMRDYEGVGIAANQVGVSLRIFVMEVRANNRRYPEYAQHPLTIYINP
jgi:peptide deformylase